MQVLLFDQTREGCPGKADEAELGVFQPRPPSIAGNGQPHLVGLLRADAVILKSREQANDAARNLACGFGERLMLAQVNTGPGVNATGHSLDEAPAMKSVEVVLWDVLGDQVTRANEAFGSNELQGELCLVFGHNGRAITHLHLPISVEVLLHGGESRAT